MGILQSKIHVSGILKYRGYYDLISKLRAEGTFTRASSASIWGSTTLTTVGANVARFDTYPLTGAYRGLLVEGVRTNLVADSTTDTGWNANVVTKTDNVLISPDGGVNATQLDMTTSGSSGMYDVIPVTAETTYTFSYFVEHISGGTTIDIGSDSSSVWGTSTAYKAIFDTATQTFASIGSAVTDYGYEITPNGWYRIWIAGDTIVGATATTTITIYNGGTTVRSFGVWGTQFEEGAFPTSLAPTAGATVTREPDRTLLDLSKEWKTGVSLYFEVEGKDISSINTIFEARDGADSALESLTLSMDATNNLVYDVTTGGVSVVNITTPIVKSSTNKIGLVFENDNCSLFLNGVKIGTDIICPTLPILSKFRLGCPATDSNYLEGYLKHIRLYETILSDSQLENMTT